MKISELDRERLIQFARDRAKEGAGPITLGIDLGHVKAILSHAAPVHGVQLSTEPTDLARIALNRLGLVGKGNERDRRLTQDEIDRIIRTIRFDSAADNSIGKDRALRDRDCDAAR